VSPGRPRELPRTSFFEDSSGCLARWRYRKNASAESIPRVTIPTEIAIATVFVCFVGCVATGIGTLAPLEGVAEGGG
jgi:hypothetical protein